MEEVLSLSGNLVQVSINVVCYVLIALTTYYYVLKPVSNFLYQIYYARRFRYIPCHFIFGHLRHLISKFPKSCVHADVPKNCYQLMMDSNDPVHGSDIAIIWVGWFPVYIVSGHRVIEAVLNKSNLTKPHFYKFMGLRDGLLASGALKWKQRRKMIEPFFNTKRYKHFVSIMNKEISKIPDQIPQKLCQPLDVESVIHTSAFNIIMYITFGLPCELFYDLKRFVLDNVEKAEINLVNRMCNPLYWFDEIFKLFDAGKSYKQTIDNITEGVRLLFIAREEVLKTSSTSIINSSSDANDKESQCLYDFLKTYNEMGEVQIDDDGITEELMTMVAAGHETISVAVRWTLFILGNNLEIQERLYQEVVEMFPDDSPVDDLDKIAQCKYLDQCLKESLRLHPPIPGVARQLDEDVVINGTKIYKNSLVILNFIATHHDANIFPNPKIYDPDRWSTDTEKTLPKGAFVPFALGPRNCIGYRYALIEMKVYLIHIIRRYNLKSLLKQNEVGYRFEVALKPTCPLKIIFTPRV